MSCLLIDVVSLLCDVVRCLLLKCVVCCGCVLCVYARCSVWFRVCCLLMVVDVYNELCALFLLYGVVCGMLLVACLLLLASSSFVVAV